MFFKLDEILSMSTINALSRKVLDWRDMPSRSMRSSNSDIGDGEKEDDGDDGDEEGEDNECVKEGGV